MADKETDVGKGTDAGKEIEARKETDISEETVTAQRDLARRDYLPVLLRLWAKQLKRIVPELYEVHDSMLLFMFFKRRVDLDYIIPGKGPMEDDPLTDVERLYPSTIVPYYYKGKHVVIIPKLDDIDLNAPPEKVPPIIVQELAERYIVPAWSRNYYKKDKWYVSSTDDPKEGIGSVYTTIIFPEEFVGDVVGLIAFDKAEEQE